MPAGGVVAAVSARAVQQPAPDLVAERHALQEAPAVRFPAGVRRRHQRRHRDCARMVHPVEIVELERMGGGAVDHRGGAGLGSLAGAPERGVAAAGRKRARGAERDAGLLGIEPGKGAAEQVERQQLRVMPVVLRHVVEREGGAEPREFPGERAGLLRPHRTVHASRAPPPRAPPRGGRTRRTTPASSGCAGRRRSRRRPGRSA